MRSVLWYREVDMQRGRQIISPFCDARFDRLFELLDGVTCVSAVSELE
jgi:hypothetical protein